jgi:membrane-associated phospholipid phosphatase
MRIPRKKLLIFCAEYLVVVEGFLFLMCILLAGGRTQQLEVLLVGGMLLVLSLTIAKILKKIVHKRRPLKKTEMFKPFDRYAFPSAHSATLFALTVYVLGQNLFVGILSLFITICIVIARVKTHVHDYVDIGGGFVIGVATVYYVAPYVIMYVTTYLLPTLLLASATA